MQLKMAIAAFSFSALQHQGFTSTATVPCWPRHREQSELPHPLLGGRSHCYIPSRKPFGKTYEDDFLKLVFLI